MLKNRLLLLAGIVFFLISCQAPKTVWNIQDYGAKGDSLTLNTAFIQTAIDECSEAGGGTVLIRDGIYVSGTVLLKDNVTLKVDEGAQLIGSDNPGDYQTIDPFTDAVGQQRGKCLIGALNAKNIAISGKGIIDGRGELFKREALAKCMRKLKLDESRLNEFVNNRPFLLRFVKSSRVTLTDISLRQPAAWTCHFFQCNDILVDGITIYSHAHKNNDGIDLDSSKDAVIKNCTIDSGDDAICFKTTSPVATQNVQVSNCRLKSDWGTIKFGTESMGDFRDISITNCYIHETRGGGIKILSVDGANIDNIKMDSIQMEKVDMPIFIRLGERLRTYRDAPKQEVGSINNVTISNVVATTWDLEESRVSPPSGIFMTGTKNHPLGAVKLENIQIYLPGRGTKEQAKVIVPEDEEKYPEFSFFGVLPSYGIMGRHMETLRISNLVIQTEAKDERLPVVMLNVQNQQVVEAKINGEQYQIQ
ncbi:glycoside hydrolase [Labilibaculum filiforme]|uniref:Glycoside hydrolase n=1 Tax=Labilibaculum filiforme TaxID=1940526 RepID=A0A2N3I4J5_9BACT|nr:glycoside hydrolase family 28 protein [Labilibaculum filiforme]PKQ65173.1 glycoside hydrolase [Labilibaculum filiforme]